jgi:hypothetical protein
MSAPLTQGQMLVQILQDLAEIKAETKRIADHEERIRTLEKIIWSASLLCAIGSAVIVTLINNMIGA